MRSACLAVCGCIFAILCTYGFIVSSMIINQYRINNSFKLDQCLGNITKTHISSTALNCYEGYVITRFGSANNFSKVVRLHYPPTKNVDIYCTSGQDVVQWLNKFYFASTFDCLIENPDAPNSEYTGIEHNIEQIGWWIFLLLLCSIVVGFYMVHLFMFIYQTFCKNQTTVDYVNIENN